MNLVDSGIKFFKFTDNVMIWILLSNTFKTNRRTTSLKMKIIFQNKVTCVVYIKIKIISITYVVVIILIKNRSVCSMNYVGFEENALKFTVNLMIWLLLPVSDKFKINKTTTSLKIKRFIWDEVKFSVTSYL